MKKLFLLMAAIAGTGAAQAPEFKLTVWRWSNHAFPEIIKPYIPSSPVEPQDGIAVLAEALNPAQRMDAVKFTIEYTNAEGSKKYRRVQWSSHVTESGCSPAPCKWSHTIFSIGADFNFDSVRVASEAIQWSSEEVE